MAVAPKFNPEALTTGRATRPAIPARTSMAYTIYYNWTNDRPVDFYLLYHNGFHCRDIEAHHFEATRMACDWLTENSNPIAKRAMLASSIPLTPKQYAAQRKSGLEAV